MARNRADSGRRAERPVYMAAGYALSTRKRTEKFCSKTRMFPGFLGNR